VHGDYLLPDTNPPGLQNAGLEDWTPFQNRIEFETADFLYRRNQMSAGDIDVLLDLWAASLLKHNDHPPFADHNDLYNVIDSIQVGNVPWQSFSMQYNGLKPEDHVPSWMDADYDVWFRDPHAVVTSMLANPDFNGELDFVPYEEFDSNNNRQFHDFMSGEWAWQQAVSSCDTDMIIF
jgi:hypothetical protein